MATTRPPYEDEVFLVHAFDDNVIFRPIVSGAWVRFPSVLDPDRLRSSLETLLRIGEWRKLSGRLRLDENSGRISVHVPRLWTADRPPIRFLHTDLGTYAIGSHPAFATLDRRLEAPSAYMGFRDVAERNKIIEPPGWRRSLADFLDPQRDEPVMALHVLTFSDATIMYINVTHLVADGGTWAEMLKGWQAVLEGRIGDVPSVRFAWHHPFDMAMQSARNQGVSLEASLLEDKKLDLGNWQTQKAHDLATGDPCWDPSEPGTGWRLISLPAAAVSLLMREAEETLSRPTSSSSSPPVRGFAKSFTLDDVLTAWIWRLVASAIPDDTRPINHLRICDSRALLIKAGWLPPGAYLGNMIYAITAFSPSAGELVRSGLGPAAAGVRAALQQQATPGQLLAWLGHRMPTCDIPLYGEPNAITMTANSWARIDVYRAANFGAAIRDTGRPGREGSVPASLPDYVEPVFDLGGVTPGPFYTCVGPDWNGDTRIHCYLTGSMWKGVEKELKRLGRKLQLDLAASIVHSKL